MYAVEFETPIQNGIVEIPEIYCNLYNNRNVRVFILPVKSEREDKKNYFNPKDYFGVANISKDEIDNYLQSSKDEWDNAF